DTIVNDELCYPNHWQDLDTDDMYFKARIDSTDKSCFIQVAKYEPAFADSTYDQYLKNIKKWASTENDGEVYNGQSVDKFVYDDKDVYAIQFYGIQKSKEYIILAYLFNE